MLMSKTRKNFILGALIGTLILITLDFTFLTGEIRLKSFYRQLGSEYTGLITKSKNDTTKTVVLRHNETGGKRSTSQLALLQDNQDGRSEAETLAEKVRVLCWILTAPQFLDHRARQVKDTWGKRCNVILFMSSVKNDSFPTVGLNVSEGRRHLIAKTMSAFRYVYENYFHEADWFMKADDDTYVIVENLRYFLSGEDPDEPVYFGQHFKAVIKNWGFLSGGAGYIISKAALRLFGEKNSVCPKDGGGEDVAFSLCMKKLGVRLGNSTDVLGRSRFHCFDPASHVSGNYRRWYLHYDIHGAKKGADSISNYPVSFHYVHPPKMYTLDFLIYHLRPYGVRPLQQDLNQKRNRSLLRIS